MRDPDRKAKVESGVGHAKKTPLKGMRFESLEEAQAYLGRWEERWADTRIHGTTKCQVSAMFAEERPDFCRYRFSPFATTNTVNVRCIWMAASKWKQRTTARRLAGSAAAFMSNGTIAMYRWSMRTRDNCCVSIYVNSAAATAFKKRTDRTELRSRPNSYFFEPISRDFTSVRCARAMHSTEGQVAVRRTLGVAALTKKYGVASTDEACAIALEVGACTYRFVRRYLERNRNCR